MKVALTLPDESGCGHYRVRYPGEVARAEGIEVEYLQSLNLKVQPDPDRGGLPKVTGVQAIDADLVVMSRPLRRINVDVIPFLQERGIAVAIDIDDDFDRIDRQHFAWRFFQPQYSPESNRKHLHRACAMADLVIVTTPALAQRYANHGRVVVLPNRVPKGMLGVVPAERDERTVGWAGHVAVHPNDLQATRGGVGLALRDAGWARFLNVGSGVDVGQNLELTEGTEFGWTGTQQFVDYPYAVARFTVGIAPLAETQFNEGKSALKGLEMAAVGVPFVASPVPDYVRIADDGIGALAGWKSKDWRKMVGWLLESEAARNELSLAGRQAVRERHTYEGEGWRWLEAWQTAIDRRQHKLTPAKAA